MNSAQLGTEGEGRRALVEVGLSSTQFRFRGGHAASRIGRGCIADDSLRPQRVGQEQVACHRHVPYATQIAARGVGTRN